MKTKRTVKLQAVSRENLPEKDLKRIVGGIRKCKDYACQCNNDTYSYSIASAQLVPGNEAKAILNPDPVL